MIIESVAKHGDKNSGTLVGESMQAEPRQCMAETCIDIALLINRIKLGYPGPLALIIDACRISPIPNLALHLTSLANRSNHPSNTLACFSTCAGGVAADGGPLQHSPFFSALIRKLTVAEMSIGFMLTHGPSVGIGGLK